MFTPIDPDIPENQQATNIALIMQLAPDIQKKLQKLRGGGEGINRSRVLGIAQKVYSYHTSIDSKQKVDSSSSGSGQGDREKRSQNGKPQTPGKEEIEKDRCAYCLLSKIILLIHWEFHIIHHPITLSSQSSQVYHPTLVTSSQKKRKIPSPFCMAHILTP